MESVYYRGSTSYLREAILMTLNALSDAVSISKLVIFTLISAPTTPFSWEQFVDALNYLVADGEVVEAEGRYRTRTEAERALERMGL